MLPTYSGNRYSVVLGLVIQYSSGEDTFSGRVSSRDHFQFKFWRGQPRRLAARPAAHRSHANTPYSWRIPPSRQGFNVLFCFIHQGRSVHLFQRVFGAVGGCLPVLAGVWGCWRALVTPYMLWFRHVNQGGLGFVGGR